VIQLLRREWFQRISPIFVGIVIANTMSIFKNYWWPQTFEFMYYTIILVAASRFLLPSTMKLRQHILELLFLTLFSMYYANVQWNGIAFAKAESKLVWIYEHALQLHPFIGIAIIVYIIHVLFSIWITKRLRIFIFTGAALLLLTVKDSFSPLVLWPNIAIVVFVFLIWHAVFHLYTLQRKHSKSFSELWEYPSGFIAPFVIIFSLLIIAVTIIPSKPPLLEDPYTLWKQSKGEAVPAFLGEKGFSKTLSSSSLIGMNSGYSRDDTQLGGSFKFNYEPVMDIFTTHKSYWRGESRWYYNGQGWEDQPPLYKDQQSLPVITGTDFSMNAYPLATTLEVEQIVTFRENSSYPVLFAAAKPFQINHINENVGLEERNIDQSALTNYNPLPYIRWVGEDAKLIYLPELADTPVRSYSIKSNILVLDVDGLKKSEAKLFEVVEQRAYTSIPDTMPQRVYELAEEVTAEADNDYDRAKLLEKYLQSMYSYTNTPDASKLTGNSNDFVDQFLFELMEGYCDYFSTAMVMLARTLDMPARWVKGFAPGVSEQDRMLQQSSFSEYYERSPNSSDTYTVRNADAHSWVEIYFADYGWVSFEPTPGFVIPYSAVEADANEEPIILPSTTEDDQYQTNQGNSLSSRLVWNVVVSIVVLAGVLLLIRYGLLFMKHRIARIPINEQMIREVNYFLIYCRMRGLRREPHHTMREAVTAWKHGSIEWQQQLEKLLSYYEIASYSKQQLTTLELEKLREIKKYLKKNWKN